MHQNFNIEVPIPDSYRAVLWFQMSFPNTIWISLQTINFIITVHVAKQMPTGRLHRAKMKGHSFYSSRASKVVLTKATSLALGTLKKIDLPTRSTTGNQSTKLILSRHNIDMCILASNILLILPSLSLSTAALTPIITGGCSTLINTPETAICFLMKLHHWFDPVESLSTRDVL